VDKINSKLLQYIGSGKVQGTVRTLAIAVFVVAIGWQLARLTLLLLPKTTDQGKWQAPPKAASMAMAHTGADIQQIKRAKLFGEAPAVTEVAKPQITNAPVTRLKLKLAGVAASSNPKTAAAIIESSGKQATYGIDEKIDGTQAILKQVETDRVVIANRGIMETLMLDSATSQRRATPRQRSPQQTNRASKTANKQDVAKLLKSAGVERNSSEAELMDKLTDFIKVSPKRENNQLVGFRVNPGKDRKLFDAIGLKPNDLAIALNGIDLTDMIQATQAVRDLAQQSEVMITVKRGEELHEFLLELPTE